MTTDLLEKISTINSRIANLEAELQGWGQLRQTLMTELEGHVKEHGPVMGHGYMASFKPGPASVDHKRAVYRWMSKDVIETYAVTETTIDWAAITASAKIDTEPYTTPGEPVFVIEEIKP